MIIYVVTQGEYSDKGNVVAFTKEENANEYIKLKKEKHGDYETYRVEDLTLDPISFDTMDYIRQLMSNGYDTFFVSMDRDGNSKVNKYSELLAEKTSYSIRIWGINQPVLVTWTWAKNEEEAVKIANEIRTQLIANDKWNENNKYTSIDWGIEDEPL